MCGRALTGPGELRCRPRQKNLTVKPRGPQCRKGRRRVAETHRSLLPESDRFRAAWGVLLCDVLRWGPGGFWTRCPALLIWLCGSIFACRDFLQGQCLFPLSKEEAFALVFSVSLEWAAGQQVASLPRLGKAVREVRKRSLDASQQVAFGLTPLKLGIVGTHGQMSSVGPSCPCLSDG